jgi:hypothetical protein
MLGTFSIEIRIGWLGGKKKKIQVPDEEVCFMLLFRSASKCQLVVE